MYLRHQFGQWICALYVRKTYFTGGFNSNLKGGGHLLMFDFDHVTLRELETQLRYVQDKYHLPTIHILSTGRPDSWHGYCFKRCGLREALKIVLDCPDIDMNFVGFAVYRKHFTIRLAPKNGRAVETHSKLYSDTPADVGIDELDSFTFYQTGSG